MRVILYQWNQQSSQVELDQSQMQNKYGCGMGQA